MSDYEHEPGYFSLFRERNPEKYKKSPPSHTGTGKIELPDGTTMNVTLAVWIKTTKDGKRRYFSGTIKEDNYQVPDDAPQGGNEDEEDEDIPF